MRSCCIEQRIIYDQLWWKMMEDNEEKEKKNVYMCMAGSICCIAEIDRTL